VDLVAHEPVVRAATFLAVFSLVAAGEAAAPGQGKLMSRRAKSPKGKAETGRSRPENSRKNAGSSVYDLEMRLADALKRGAEALEQIQRCNRELAESQGGQAATPSELYRLAIVARLGACLPPLPDNSRTAAVRLP
jgi:hypothetical protein